MAKSGRPPLTDKSQEKSKKVFEWYVTTEDGQ